MIKAFELEERMLRAKVPIPFVEENSMGLPSRVFVDGYFPAGTVFKFEQPVCSKMMGAYGDQVNDYCHAAALVYSNKLNGAADDETEYTVTFHVDLSALFLLLEPLDEDGNVVPL